MKVGILGGGQLGQMLMLGGYPLDIRSTAYTEVANSSASLVGEVTNGQIDQTQLLHNWAAKCDVITYEFENYPAELVGDLTEVRPVHPDVNALAIAQDRWQEKRLFVDLEIPVTPFRLVRNEVEVKSALSELKSPVIFKTRTGGYDGKGQITISEGDSINAVLDLLETNELVAEERVALTTEVSIIGVRGLDGSAAVYPMVENEHRSGILHKSSVPARVPSNVTTEAEKYMAALLKHLNYVGVLTLELFVSGNRLLANEMAPRVHNSGHWTIEGAVTSQFENHMRAITGLPIGNTELVGPTAMINLIGAIPREKAILRIPRTHLHLYGKEPRPGRKVGHITVTAQTDKQLQKSVASVEALVSNVLS
jgi:5-(carboxyamino)imidazole ribonucleotide synthase